MRALKIILVGMLLLAIPASANASQPYRLSEPMTTPMAKNKVVMIGSYAFEAFHPEAGSKITYILRVDLRTQDTKKVVTLETGSLVNLGASSGRLALIAQDVDSAGVTTVTVYTVALDGSDRRVVATSSYVGAQTCGNEIKSFKTLADGGIAIQVRNYGLKTPNGDSCQAPTANAIPQPSNTLELRDAFGNLVESETMPENFDVDAITFDPTGRYFLSFGDSAFLITPFIRGEPRRYSRDTRLGYLAQAGPNHALWIFSDGSGRTSGILRFYPEPEQSQRSKLVARKLRRHTAVSYCGNDIWFVASDSHSIKKYSPRTGKVSNVFKSSRRFSHFVCSSNSAVVWEGATPGDDKGRVFSLTPR